MSDFFKLLISSKAKTKKEIQEEIQRIIRVKIENITENADAEIRGEKIPPRDNIRYDAPRHSSAAPEATELAYAPELTDETAPIADRIREMRKLGQTLYRGFTIRQCAEVSIVKQGEYMCDVADDFNRSVYCGIERPVYGALSFEQLRTYFTWRTDVRRGVFLRTDKAYVTLYCYELLNKIGALSSQDAFDRLISVWENCRSFCPSLDETMPQWLSDFYAFNEIEGEFTDIAAAFPVQDESCGKDICELEAGNYENKLEYLMGCSSYNLKGSIFFSEETAPVFEAVLSDVLRSMNEYFKERGISLFELICGKPRKDHFWTPFCGAFVDLDRMDGFHACRINSYGQYCTKRGEPCLERFEYAPYRSLIGYILKSTEAVLRKRMGFRYTISANLSPVLDDFTNRSKLHKAASEEAFSCIIPDAVNEWCDRHGIMPPKKESKKKSGNHFAADDIRQAAPQAPPKIEINIESLAAIREEAEQTARKLIIEEYEDSIPTEEIEQITARIVDEVFDEQTENACAQVGSGYDFSGLPEGWRQLARSLDVPQLELLNALMHGSAESLCRERGVLPETAYEELNSAALEHIGDCLIENGEVIPDYMEEISLILDCMAE